MEATWASESQIKADEMDFRAISVFEWRQIIAGIVGRKN